MATYTATLPPEIQTETYAYFLEGKCVVEKCTVNVNLISDNIIDFQKAAKILSKP